MRTTHRAVLVLLTLAAVLVIPASPASASTTSRSSAVYYADHNTANPPNTYTNPTYQRFSADCTNFISQAMVAGGWPRVSIGSGQNYYWYPYTQAWVTVVEWKAAMTSYGWIGAFREETKSASYTSADLGDIYGYDWGRGGGLDHYSMSAGWAYNGRAGMYSSDGQGDYIDQHTTDRMHAPWNYGYLHPDSNTNPATMHIWTIPLKYNSA